MPSLRSQALLTRATRQQVKTAPAAKPKGYEGKPKPKTRGKKTNCDIENGTSMVNAPILNTINNGTAVPTEEPLTKPASASHVEISEPTHDAETSSPTGGSPLESVSAPDAKTLAPTNDSPPEAVSTPDDETSALTNGASPVAMSAPDGETSAPRSVSPDAEIFALTDDSPPESCDDPIPQTASAPDAETSAPSNDLPSEAVSTLDDQTSALSNGSSPVARSAPDGETSAPRAVSPDAEILALTDDSPPESSDDPIPQTASAPDVGTLAITDDSPPAQTDYSPQKAESTSDRKTATSTDEALPETVSPQLLRLPETEDEMRPDLVLGAIDAYCTKSFIDTDVRTSHKYVEPPTNIFAIISNNPQHQKLFSQMMESYSSSFESVKYVDIPGYQGGIEFSVRARKALPKGLKIRGVDGYFADAVQNAPSFSVFGATDNNSKERIMLGPASFINHSCEPNAVFVCGGPTKNQTVLRVETTRGIAENEEIFVSYGGNYFGQNNVQCLCQVCKGNSSDDSNSTEQRKAKSYSKKTKYDDVTQCPICEKTSKRIDKHLSQQHPELTRSDIVMLKDFFRTQHLHANTKVFFCSEHNRRFIDRASHKRSMKCNDSNISVVANHQSRT